MKHFVAVLTTPFVALLASTALAAPVTTTIDFNGLGNPNSVGAFTTYTESGYTVTATVGAFDYNNNSYGNPIPSIFDEDPGSATVTDGGALFTFDSVDLGNANGAEGKGYTLTGYDGATQVFTDSGFVPITSTFQTISPDVSHDDITSLVITLTGGTDTNIDNIVLTSVPATVTPEPSGLALLATGVLGLAGTMRKRLFHS